MVTKVLRELYGMDSIHISHRRDLFVQGRANMCTSEYVVQLNLQTVLSHSSSVVFGTSYIHFCCKTASF